jgi:hypothetical protein
MAGVLTTPRDADHLSRGICLAVLMAVIEAVNAPLAMMIMAMVAASAPFARTIVACAVFLTWMRRATAG